MIRFDFLMDSTKVIDPLTIEDIVSSKSFLDGNWMEQTKHLLFKEKEVQKFFIPIDNTYWNIDIITFVEKGTVIPEHSHDEPVLRYVLQGSLELNGEIYKEGDWVLVPANKQYQILTREGYKILSKYHAQCAECQWSKLSKLPLGKIGDANNP
ncbi:MAG: hypothetical protein EON51_02270 [Acinetobacter sp.]|nr:MAG: hypothetical protein EON51_02270 [Acinetobacter sp.]